MSTHLHRIAHAALIGFFVGVAVLARALLSAHALYGFDFALAAGGGLATAVGFWVVNGGLKRGRS